MVRVQANPITRNAYGDWGLFDECPELQVCFAQHFFRVLALAYVLDEALVAGRGSVRPKDQLAAKRSPNLAPVFAKELAFVAAHDPSFMKHPYEVRPLIRFRPELMASIGNISHQVRG